MKLSDIANLQSGLVLNRKEARFSEETKKTYKRLNLKSLGPDNEIDHHSLDMFSSKEILDQNILTHLGDIVIKLFAPIYPVVISEEDVGLVIPSQLAVIRVFNNAVNPQYLRYWLSTPEALELIQTNGFGQMHRAIKLGSFADLDVPIPPLKSQKIISELILTNNRRERLYKELIEEENKYTMLNIQRIIGVK